MAPDPASLPSQLSEPTLERKMRHHRAQNAPCLACRPKVIQVWGETGKVVPYQVFSQIARLGWLVKVQEVKGKVKSEKLSEEK